MAQNYNSLTFTDVYVGFRDVDQTIINPDKHTPFCTCANCSDHSHGPDDGFPTYTPKKADGGGGGDDGSDGRNQFRPSVVAHARKVGVGDTIKARKLFATKDLDGDPITRVRFFDSSGVATSGYFTVNGNRKRAQEWFELGMGAINSVKYHGGLLVGAERFSVQVYDGEFWSLVDSDTLSTVTSNRRLPIVNGDNGRVLAYESIQLQNLFTARDPDGYDITNYRIKDLGGAGHFRVNGKRMQPGKSFTVGPGLISRVRYHGALIGRGSASENVEIQAYDGQNWSLKETVKITTAGNANPFILTGRNNIELAVDEVVDLATILTYRDPDQNTLKKIRVFDSGVLNDGGRFELNGSGRAARKWHTFTASQLSNLMYRASQTRDTEKLRFQINDGRYWSEVETVTVKTIDKPVIEVLPTVIVDHLETVNSRDIVSQTDGGPLISKYQFFDLNPARSSGHLVHNGSRLAGKKVHEFTRSDLRNLDIEGAKSDFGRDLDKMYVRGWNGEEWSDWSRISLHTETNMLTAMETGRSWFGQRPQGGEITYSFTLEVPFYYADDTDEWDGRDSFSPMTPDQRIGIRRAFDLWGQMTGLTFREVSDNIGGEIRVGQYDFDGAAAYAYLPGGQSGRNSVLGDIWFSSSQATTFQMDDGEYGFLTALHEIGHAIGIDHPFFLSGVDETPPYLPPQTDNNRFTVMSYTTNTDGPNPNPATPMLYDLMHAQSIYGAETEINKGNTVYRYDPNDSLMKLIWDPAGTDTLNFFNYTLNMKVDLRSGVWSNIGGRDQNFMIAYGTTIENLVGGSGNDVLNGNEANNRIQGGRGKDRLNGGGGLDVLMGQQGSDRYTYDQGDGRIIIDEQKRGGADVLQIKGFTKDLSRLDEDLTFSRNGNDLKIDLTFNRGRSEGSVVIKNYKFAGSRVETLELFRSTGKQIGTDIDLTSVWVQATPEKQQFKLTQFRGDHGFLAVPV